MGRTLKESAPMPRGRAKVNAPQLLELLPAEHRRKILEEALASRAREIVEQHLDEGLGRVFEALKADPSWKELRELSARQVLRTAAHAGGFVRSVPKELKKELTNALKQERGNVTQVAHVMGKHRFQIQRWLKKFGLDPADYK
jgi:transcriptional regulator of acetoin/glycerol metabolism